MGARREPRRHPDCVPSPAGRARPYHPHVPAVDAPLVGTARSRPRLPALTAAAVAALLAACVNPAPTPSPGPSTSPADTTLATEAPSPSPTAQASPTQAAATTFHLAVVTGLTNLKSVVTIDELTALARSGKLLVPCGIAIDRPPMPPPASACVAANQVVGSIAA